ncbi:MAG: hydroxymethylglutaryl-CoA lyase [Deltaproteobacteria bacterium]|nr:hydroxymethylglutaryl-CoA lyase [Candidatus Anaeroferrophillus wilburensis]MBN2890032.1 hydroxymethylglutaryl-CoA lyase [Deltaproteobacteria bacterium]
MVHPYNALPATVRVVEVGPRDGWQNLPEFLATEQKISLINALSACGFAEIEVSSFVSPRAIPQLRDAADVFAAIDRVAGTVYSALVPNERGLEQAIDAGVDKVGFFISASETHNRHNIGQTIAETRAVIGRMTTRVPTTMSVRASISNVFGCPYEGRVPVAGVAGLVSELISLGINEITLCDTLGVATPLHVAVVLEHLATAGLQADFGLHLHDTCGRALAGVVAGLQMGITRFDSAVGGLGGCPYAPGAAGNLATEDLVFCLEDMGLATGIKPEALVQAAELFARTIPQANSHMLGFLKGCEMAKESTAS